MWKMFLIFYLKEKFAEIVVDLSTFCLGVISLFLIVAVSSAHMG